MIKHLEEPIKGSKTIEQYFCPLCLIGRSNIKLDGVGPVDNRPSTAEAPPIVKIQPVRKIAVTPEPVMQFRMFKQIAV